MKQIYDRTALLIGQQGLDCLRQSHVLVAGVGGVGSFAVEALTYSPIKGPEGNIEYLVYLRYEKGSRPESEGFTGLSMTPDWQAVIDRTVTEAHRELDKE